MFDLSPSIAILAGVVVGVVIVAGVGLYLWRVTARDHRRREQADLQFVGIVGRAIVKGALKELDDLYTLYRARFGTRGTSLRDLHHLKSLLDRVVLTLTDGGVDNAVLATALPLLKSLSEGLDATIGTEEKREPFDDAPQPERALLLEILALTTSDRELVHSKLAQLGGLVSAREQTVKALAEEKGQAVRLSRWGLGNSGDAIKNYRSRTRARPDARSSPRCSAHG